MPGKKLDKPAHKRLLIQLKRYRKAQKKSEKSKADDGSNDCNDYGYSDSEENQDQKYNKNVSSGEIGNRDLNFCTKVTTDDIKNLVLASYRSLSKQITNLSNQIEEASSRLSTLESLVKNMNMPDEKKIEEPTVEEEARVTRGNNNQDKKDKDVVILDSSDSKSESESNSDSDSESEYEEKKKNSVKAFDTSIRLSFPLKTKNDFYIFNAKIAQPRYRSRVVSDLSHLVNKYRTMSKNVEKIFRHYLTKNVLLCYNSQTSTNKKKVFIDTLFYECIAEVLRKLSCKPVSDERIHGSITTVLKSARNWSTYSENKC